MSTSMPIRRLASLALAVTIASTACTGASATPSASSGASATPAAPSTSATSSPTPAPSPTPTATPGPLVIEWTREQVTGLQVAGSISDLLAVDGGLILAADLPQGDDFRSGLWRSSDGLAWELVAEQDDRQRIAALVAGGPGYVGVGMADGDPGVWTSADGTAWERVRDDSLRNGSASSVVATDSGLIAFGTRGDADTGALWTSADGREWLAATNETGLEVAAGLQAVSAWDGRAVALVKSGEADPIAVWETTGRADWTRVGELPDSANASVSAAAGGPRGWVAVGGSSEADTPLAWASEDGRTWRAVGGGPDVTSDLIADASGFIAVGHIGSVPGETCGDSRDFAMHTWTSADGSTWDLMPVEDTGIASVLQAAVVDRTLLGIGLDYGAVDPGSGEGMPMAWTAPLPGIASPIATSDEGTLPQGCGP